MKYTHQSNIPYEIDPEESDVTVHYDYEAGYKQSWDDPGVQPHIMINAIVRNNDGTEIDIMEEPYASWVQGDLTDQIWQSLQVEPEPTEYLPGESKMRPINDAAFLDLLSESCRGTATVIIPFRHSQIVRARPNSHLWRFLEDYGNPMMKMKVIENYVMEHSINYDYICVPFSDASGWISEQRLPVKHDDLISEQAIRSGHFAGLDYLVPGMSFKFSEDVDGMDGEYMVADKEAGEITIESRTHGHRFSISEDGAKDYKVEVLKEGLVDSKFDAWVETLESQPTTE